jgi:PAS domain S-box-containing protein
MKELLHVLIVEDSPGDAELMNLQLQKEDLLVDWQRVDNEADYRKALDGRPDLILSDWSLPGFSGSRALQILNQINLEIPFVIVSGSIGEEVAVEALRSGASDYVLKDRPSRLGPAVRRALEDHRIRQERLAATAALKESEERYQRISEMISTYAYSFRVENDRTFTREWVAGGFERTTGFTPEELDERGGWSSMVYPDDMPVNLLRTQRLLAGEDDVSEYRIVSKNGGIFWLRDFGNPIWSDSEGRVVRIYGAAEDITERKNAEEKIAQALREKETLLRELYHRTKNNMEVIQSILSLEATQASSEIVKQIVRETSDRIQAMALVHERLYQSRDLSSIDLYDYIQELAEYLFNSYNLISQRVSLKYELEHIRVLIDTAIPCGLILNELMSNSLKFAFPDDLPGEISIRLSRPASDTIDLWFADDGVGVPAGFDFRSQTTFGMRSLVALVEHQLQGKIEFLAQNGLTCHLQFPDPISLDQARSEN